MSRNQVLLRLRRKLARRRKMERNNPAALTRWWFSSLPISKVDREFIERINEINESVSRRAVSLFYSSMPLRSTGRTADSDSVNRGSNP